MNITSSVSRKFNNLPLNIREKVTLPYLLLAIILIMGAVFVVTRVVFDTIEERFTNQLLEAGILATERMVVEEDQMLKTFRLLSYSNGVAEALSDINPEKLRELTFGTIVNNRQESVIFLDLEGNLILSAQHLDGGNIEEYEFGTGGISSWRDQPFVQAVIKGQSDDHGNKYAAYANSGNKAFFFISGPVYSENEELVGVLLVGKSLQELVKQIREETLAQVTIYDFEGKVLGSTFAAPSPINKQIADEVVVHQENSTLVFKNSRQVNIRNIGYREIFSTWDVRNREDLGIMGIALGESFLISTTNITRIQIALLAGLIFVLVIIIGLNLSKLITTPILELVSASKKVMDGDLNVEIQSASNDELAVMANTFNQMVRNVRDSKNEIIDSYDSTLEGWTKALDLRNEETKGHTDRVIDLMNKTARIVGIGEDKLVNIRRGCLLHDIGKMGVPDRILNKPGPLSEEEWEIMRHHPIYAYHMLKDIQFLAPALPIPYCHHEKWDGSGYPRGLKGEEIPIEARIFALVDVWDALTSDRVYRKALSKAEAIKIMKDGIGTHFDPEISNVFLEIVS
ncbi:MAG TPA: HD domain-containing phosphohydrolase [Anaerolineaceae bacterium]|nr:HD domain-containing phosphohydrolase [Anaerolineaceae bacterium]